MADAATRHARAARTVPQLAASDLLQPLPPAQRWVLRGAPAVRAAAERAFGVSVPADACRAATLGGRAALWLGPDEWLLLAEAEDACESLGAALADLPHSLVDVSHRQTAFCVAGPQAATLLAAGCPLDLDERAFPTGMCTRTMCAKAEIVLWRPAPPVFRIEVWRSYAIYLTQFVVEAADGMI